MITKEGWQITSDSVCFSSDRFAEFAFASEARNCAKSEVSAIDKPIKPNVNVQESVENAKFYCKRYPDSFVSLRDYSGDIYNQTCTAFAAEQQATDSSYKIGSD